MTAQPQPVLLNQGLNTITPALLAKEGSLIDCLNYEMTGLIGYRRIDGFERYDGWASGDMVDYFLLEVNITDAGIEPQLLPGSVITSAEVGETPVGLGVLIDYDSVSGIITYSPLNKDAPIIPSGSLLDLDYITPSRMNAASVAEKGSQTDLASDFIDNVRTYSAALRAQTTSQRNVIAGLHWFRNNPIVAIDLLKLTYEDTTTVNDVIVGTKLQLGLQKFRVIERTYSNPVMTLLVEPIGIPDSTAGVLVRLDQRELVSTAINASSILLEVLPSTGAYLVALHTPETAPFRGVTTLSRSVFLRYENGLAAAESLFVKNSIVSVGDATDYVGAFVISHVLLSGTFAGNDAVGLLEVVLDPLLPSSGVPYAPVSGDEIGESGIAAADITAAAWSTLAGTVSIRKQESRYQWLSQNFYGQQYSERAYGTTGASRGFWANAYVDPLTKEPPLGVQSVTTEEYAWGSIYTNPQTTSEPPPKYLSVHNGNRLVFGYFGGSVLLSEAGNPNGFDGALGALEIGTGNRITGLLEGPSDSTIVFHDNAIRYIVGNSDQDIQVKTISGNSGAFDYTAVLVGGIPLFTGPAGVSTLQQSEKYGDFQGERITYSVSNELVPKLITDFTDTEAGGVSMALPVRSKDQYLLWLTTGEVYTVTVTEDGPKIMKRNYGQSVDVRAPLAWTSRLADSGKEHVLVVWDDVLALKQVNVLGTSGTIPDPTRVYELNRGWGFDGETFSHFFDVTYSFVNGGVQFTGITKMRMHGTGYGIATLDIKSSGIENDYDQPYQDSIQDLSIPSVLTQYTSSMRPVTAFVDHANWGNGIKLRVNGTLGEGLTTTEPSHVCQVLIIYLREEGDLDG
jgi:hypothetical protein